MDEMKKNERNKELQDIDGLTILRLNFPCVKNSNDSIKRCVCDVELNYCVFSLSHPQDPRKNWMKFTICQGSYRNMNLNHFIFRFELKSKESLGVRDRGNESVIDNPLILL